MPKMEYMLLRTKLLLPTLSSDLLDRPQIVDILNQALNRTLTLVSAPAGFGKTTGVCQWLQSRSQLVAWLSLDRDDSDFERFLHYLVAALQTISPSFGADALYLLQTEHPPALDDIATILCNDLLEIPAEFIVVLDDYHLVQEQTVHRLLEKLIDYFPTHGHLVLISRADPLLPLARWRGRGQLTEIRTTELRFTTSEITAYLRQIRGLSAVTPKVVSELAHQTEGWITGLRLLAPTLPENNRLPGSYTWSNPHIWSYLVEEVLALQSPAVQTFLLQTSILEWLCPALCDAVLHDATGATPAAENQAGSFPAGSQSRDILESLRQANLFVVPIDEAKNHYRYHPLFQGLLQQRLRVSLTEAEIAALHRRAGEWLAESGEIELALSHMLAAGQIDRVVALVEESLQILLAAEAYRKLDRWIELLPKEYIRQQPVLLLTQAWQQRYRFRLGAVVKLLKQATALLDNGAVADPQLERVYRARIDAMYSEYYFGMGDYPQSSHCAEQALATLPPSAVQCRALAISYLGLSRQAMGHLSDALQILNSFMANEASGDPFLETRTLVAIQFVYYLSGHFGLLDQVSERVIKVATMCSLSSGVAWGHYFQGIITYEKNLLETAEGHFLKVNQLRQALPMLLALDSYLGLSLVYQAQGRGDKVEQTLNEAAEFVLEQRNLELQFKVESFRARLAWQRGAETGVSQPGWGFRNNSQESSILFLEVPALTQARLSLVQPTPARLEKGLHITQHWLQTVETAHNTYLTIAILALQALIYEAQGQYAQALVVLERSLMLAQPIGLLRTYVDLGPVMAQLLRVLARRGVASGYIGQILAAFGSPPVEINLAVPQPAVNPPTPAAGADPSSFEVGLIEPLSDRELEVLWLLFDRFSNKEIAQHLVISPLTVKKHTSNIYQKLRVNNRRGAVTKAQELGLLVTDRVLN